MLNKEKDRRKERA